MAPTMATVILFNKPYRVICQFSDQGAPGAKGTAPARPTLKDYLPQRDVYPAGRLDTDSEGLVVLTADGVLQHRITDPRHKLQKTYFAEVEGEPSATTLHQLRSGVHLGEFRALPAQARWVPPPDWLWSRVPPVRFRKHIPTSWLEITLSEGKNRQVRRMTAAAGSPTLRLIRFRVGNWTIDGLKPGEWREQTLEPTASRPASPRKNRGSKPPKPPTASKRPR
jgi:23S rRNA pseudouridine2457 synthase